MTDLCPRNCSQDFSGQLAFPLCQPAEQLHLPTKFLYRGRRRQATHVGLARRVVVHSLCKDLQTLCKVPSSAHIASLFAGFHVSSLVPDALCSGEVSKTAIGQVCMNSDQSNQMPPPEVASLAEAWPAQRPP